MPILNKDMANRIQSQEHLNSSIGRIDRLMTRNWWYRLWNKEVK